MLISPMYKDVQCTLYTDGQNYQPEAPLFGSHWAQKDRSMVIEAMGSRRTKTLDHFNIFVGWKSRRNILKPTKIYSQLVPLWSLKNAYLLAFTPTSNMNCVATCKSYHLDVRYPVHVSVIRNPRGETSHKCVLGNKDFGNANFISPQSERSELGAFYFCPGVLSGYCFVCESGYCNWFWNTNIIKWLLWCVCVWVVTVIECAIWGLQKSGKFGCSGHTFRRWIVTMDFDSVSLHKYGQFIKYRCYVRQWMCYMGSSEKWQILGVIG